MQQCPSFRQQGVGLYDVRQLLDKFGEKCLIILDGIDEFKGKDETVIRMIEGIPQCSILMTSRPHGVAHIEPSFENVLQIKGFSRDHAEIFCDKALHSKDQKNAVVLFYENNFHERGHNICQSNATSVHLYSSRK